MKLGARIAGTALVAAIALGGTTGTALAHSALTYDDDVRYRAGRDSFVRKIRGDVTGLYHHDYATCRVVVKFRWHPDAEVEKVYRTVGAKPGRTEETRGRFSVRIPLQAQVKAVRVVSCS